MGKRLLLGILKGLLIGGTIGALVHFVGEGASLGGWLNYPLYAGVGALSGVLAGRAPWKPGAWIASILKGAFGLGIGIGLYALGAWLFKADFSLLGSTPAPLAHHPLIFAPLVALLYSTFVEIDDGGEQPEEAGATGVRAGKPLSVEDIDICEDEEAAKPAAKSAKKN